MYTRNSQHFFQMGLFWLFVVTSTISLISTIIVDTIDGFASRSKMSEVFTSVIIVPYFSNIAEQVSAVIFAYRNKMEYVYVKRNHFSCYKFSRRLKILLLTILTSWHLIPKLVCRCNHRERHTSYSIRHALRVFVRVGYGALNDFIFQGLRDRLLVSWCGLCCERTTGRQFKLASRCFHDHCLLHDRSWLLFP